MKSLIAVILFSLLSFQVEARKGASLNDAVKHAESEGRVISARTINDIHEVKVLTPSGTVKTLNINAGGSTKKIKPPRPEYYNRGGQSMRDRKNNPVVPQRFHSNKRQQRTIKLDTRQLDRQPSSRNRGSTKNNRSKDKDK
jgi:hypothetical protein